MWGRRGQEHRSGGVLSNDEDVNSDEGEQGFILCATELGGRGEQGQTRLQGGSEASPAVWEENQWAVNKLFYI